MFYCSAASYIQKREEEINFDHFIFISMISYSFKICCKRRTILAKNIMLQYTKMLSTMLKMFFIIFLYYLIIITLQRCITIAINLGLRKEKLYCYDCKTQSPRKCNLSYCTLPAFAFSFLADNTSKNSLNLIYAIS